MPDKMLLPAVSRSRRSRLNDVAVGIVGCGNHATTAILPSLRHAPVRLIAVCDLDRERADGARAQFGAESAYESAEDLLARTDLDAVLVVGPPDMHVAIGMLALESGRHVFIEKPPANTLADALRLQRASQAAGKQLMVGFMKRFTSAHRLVKQIIADEEFGSITSMHMTYAHWPVAGLRFHLTDMSIHAIDTMRWLVGDPTAMTMYKRSIRDNHVLALTAEFASGAMAHLDLSAFQPGVQERLSVVGEQTVVRVENLTRLEYVRQAPGAPDEECNTRLVSSWTPEFAIPFSEYDSLVIQGYATEMIAFADAVREGRQVSPSIDDGVAAMRLIEAIIAAPEGLSTAALNEGGA
jgi:myo-inositol 2-dehydrogenase/D-chiro-inositol 1-dehydrogenase